MRKRLQKKRHLGPFQELGFEFHASLRPGVDYLPLLDRFIDEAIEAHGCFYGGTCGPESLNGFVQVGRKSARAVEKRAQVLAWMRQCSDITSWRATELVDAWYPPRREPEMTETGP